MDFSDADSRVPDPANNRNTTLASIRREGLSTIEGSTLSRFRSPAPFLAVPHPPLFFPFPHFRHPRFPFRRRCSQICGSHARRGAFNPEVKDIVRGSRSCLSFSTRWADFLIVFNRWFWNHKIRKCKIIKKISKKDCKKRISIELLFTDTIQWIIICKLREWFED